MEQDQDKASQRIISVNTFGLIHQKKALWGNRCYHQTAVPIFYERPKHWRKTYDVLEMASETLKTFYFKPNQYLAHLRYARESHRQQRSEAREALCRFSQVMLNHLDLASMEIVQYTPQGKNQDEYRTACRTGKYRFKACIPCA